MSQSAHTLAMHPAGNGQPPSPARGRTRGFSLPELLAVLGILAIASAWLIPSLPGLLRSHAMRSAVDQVLASLCLGRSLALTSGTPHLWAAVPASRGWPTEYPLRAFAVFRLQNDTAAGDVPAAPLWIQATPWKWLPEGILFEPRGPGPFRQPPETVRCPVLEADLPVHGITFAPDGTAAGGEQPVLIRIAAAQLSPGGFPKKTGASETIRIRPPTGIARVDSPVAIP